MGWVVNDLASLPPGNTRYSLYRRLARPQDRSGLVRKISPPPAFDPRTVQLVASRYTDWAIATPRNILTLFLFCCGNLTTRHPVHVDLKLSGRWICLFVTMIKIMFIMMVVYPTCPVAVSKRPSVLRNTLMLLISGG